MKYSNYSTVFLTHPVVIETVGSLHKTPLPYRWLTALIAIIPLIILNFVHVDGQYHRNMMDKLLLLRIS